MQPGLTRAVPMGIGGFMLGAAFVLVLRALQSMEPLWDAQTGIIMAGLGATIGFLWGVGAFNTKLAVHHMEAHYDDTQGIIVVDSGHHDDHEGEAEGRGLLTGEVWQVAFWTILLFTVIFLFASWQPGPSLTISSDSGANTNTIGYYTMEIAGREIVVSQLTALIIFVAIAFISLGVIGGLIALVFYNLSTGVAEVKAAGNIPLNALPSGSVAGLLTAGDEEGETTGVPYRSASNKARAFVVPSLLNFAVIYPNVVLALATFGIGDTGVQLTLGALIGLALTMLIISRFTVDPVRQAELAPARVVGVGIVVIVALWAVFSVIVGFVASQATWLYIPVEPVLQQLPLLNALFLAPFVLDLIFNPGRPAGEAARFVIIPALVFNILYPVFYGAAIGLVFPLEPMRTMVTAINVVLITLLVLYPGAVLWSLGKFAAGIVWVLRHVPQFLGQK